jgi:membrane protein implicated in regulation of membrane protease activity
MQSAIPWLIGAFLVAGALYFHWRLDVIFVLLVFLAVIYRWLRKPVNTALDDPPKKISAPSDVRGFQEAFLREKPPQENEKPR